MRTAMLLIALAACPLGDTWEPVEQVDQGTACLTAEADGTGTIEVYSDGCLSSSCDRNREASCEATLDGDTITVTSTFTWETATGTQACTDDCGTMVATCTVGPLPAGTYSVVHGDDVDSVDVPTEGECDPWQ